MEQALSNMTDGNKCIPWYFPQLDPDMRMCSPFEARDFKNKIDVMTTNLCQVCVKYLSLQGVSHLLVGLT